MTAWNAICAVGTAVTSALGAAFAFLTSPIGLVCVAIAAIIAIGVLLYKNWDTVKEKASQLGDWIVGVFNNLKERLRRQFRNSRQIPGCFCVPFVCIRKLETDDHKYLFGRETGLSGRRSVY